MVVVRGGSGKREVVFFFSSRRRHTRFKCDWSSDVCSSDLKWRLTIWKTQRGCWSVSSRSAGGLSSDFTSGSNGGPGGSVGFCDVVPAPFGGPPSAGSPTFSSAALCSPDCCVGAFQPAPASPPGPAYCHVLLSYWPRKALSGHSLIFSWYSFSPKNTPSRSSVSLYSAETMVAAFV